MWKRDGRKAVQAHWVSARPSHRRLKSDAIASCCNRTLGDENELTPTRKPVSVSIRVASAGKARLRESDDVSAKAMTRKTKEILLRPRGGPPRLSDGCSVIILWLSRGCFSSSPAVASRNCPTVVQWLSRDCPAAVPRSMQTKKPHPIAIGEQASTQLRLQSKFKSELQPTSESKAS